MIEAAALGNHNYEPVPEWLKKDQEHLKTQGMCDEAVRINRTAFYLFMAALKLKRCVMLQCS